METFFHFFVTSVLTGLIWVIQVVHYPSFKWIAATDYVSYAVFHTNRITYVVAPLMLAELFFTLRLFFLKDIPIPLIWSAAILTLIVWASTFFLQVPLHGILASHKDLVAIERLVSTNWIRTVAWSLKATVLGWIVLSMITGKAGLQ